MTKRLQKIRDWMPSDSVKSLAKQINASTASDGLDMALSSVAVSGKYKLYESMFRLKYSRADLLTWDDHGEALLLTGEASVKIVPCVALLEGKA